MRISRLTTQRTKGQSSLVIGPSELLTLTGLHAEVDGHDIGEQLEPEALEVANGGVAAQGDEGVACGRIGWDGSA